MYVPIIKNQAVEMKVFKELKSCFSKDIMPMFEIISDIFEPVYKLDPVTQKPIKVKKPGNKTATKVKIGKSVVTLDKISSLMCSNSAFIDYFRYDPKIYGGRQIEINKCLLSSKLNNEPKLYSEKLLDVANYSNLIPVISIKPAFNFNISELINLINSLHNKTKRIALRITKDYLDMYKDILENHLFEDDYILFDIGEKTVSTVSKYLTTFSNLKITANTILVNSPRKRHILNGDYDTGITPLIDTTVNTSYANYGFNGFGDYGGLRDKMPTKGGSNGTGHALAILYSNVNHKFYSFLNDDVNLGVKGYNSVIQCILNIESTLNPDNDCPVIDAIKTLHHTKKTNNWSGWIGYTLSRTLHQMFKLYSSN